MVIFQSEADLLAKLATHDELVRRCASGQLTFDRFCEEYGNFYGFFALDGHESDEEERALLERYYARIEPHRIIAYDILGLVCSEDNAQRDSYKQAGRFGSGEAVARMRKLKLEGSR